jgi:hypothetical protein
VTRIQPSRRRPTLATGLRSLETNEEERVTPLVKWMVATAVLGGALLGLSGVFDNAHGFEGVLGGIGWFGFLACVLALIALVVTTLGRSLFRRAAASSS